MKYRKSHCAVAKLNSSGKCIAPCAWNDIFAYTQDCTGHQGKTTNLEKGREVPLMRQEKTEEVMKGGR